jgi:hypothetical protein
MDGDWNAWHDAWPDWGDGGRRVGLRIDGVEAEGVLVLNNFFLGGEDEFPIWEVVTDAGERIPFGMNDEWRFIPSLGASRLVTGSAGATSG